MTIRNIYLHGSVIGKVTVEKEGLYYNFNCVCDLPVKEIFRIHAVTPFERINLGVCIPEKGCLRVMSRVPVSRIGDNLPKFCAVPKNEETSDFYELIPNQPFENLNCLRECSYVSVNGRRGIVRKHSLD